MHVTRPLPCTPVELGITGGWKREPKRVGATTLLAVRGRRRSHRIRVFGGGAARGRKGPIAPGWAWFLVKGCSGYDAEEVYVPPRLFGTTLQVCMLLVFR